MVQIVPQHPVLLPGRPPRRLFYGVRTLEGWSRVQIQTVGFSVKLQQRIHQLRLWQRRKGCVCPMRVARGPLGILLPSMPGPNILCGIGAGPVDSSPVLTWILGLHIEKALMQQ